MLEDLSADEYFDFRSAYLDSPWGPYTDAARWFVATPFKPGTNFDEVRGFGNKPKDADDIQEIIDQVNQATGEEADENFFQRENERLKAKHAK